jgi:hypothetical protein
MNEDRALEKWEKLVYDRASTVDEQDERDWYDMAYGFFLALGFDVEDAHALACVARGVATT